MAQMVFQNASTIIETAMSIILLPLNLYWLMNPIITIKAPPNKSTLIALMMACERHWLSVHVTSCLEVEILEESPRDSM